jgi:hypothetical protein
LVPHLPDDDLFNMHHILQDRSQETIKVYLSSLLDRDVPRTKRILTSEKRLGEKAGNAIAAVAERLFERRVADQDIAFASSLLVKIQDYSWGQYGPKATLLRLVVQHFPQHEQTWDWITQIACKDENDSVRQNALALLARERPEVPATWDLITERARQDQDASFRWTALKLLAKGRPEVPATWDLITECARQDQDASVRQTAPELLARRRPEVSVT